MAAAKRLTRQRRCLDRVPAAALAQRKAHRRWYCCRWQQPGQGRLTQLSKKPLPVAMPRWARQAVRMPSGTSGSRANRLAVPAAQAPKRAAANRGVRASGWAPQLRNAYGALGRCSPDRSAPRRCGARAGQGASARKDPQGAARAPDTEAHWQPMRRSSVPHRGRSSALVGHHHRRSRRDAHRGSWQGLLHQGCRRCPQQRHHQRCLPPAARAHPESAAAAAPRGARGR